MQILKDKKIVLRKKNTSEHNAKINKKRLVHRTLRAFDAPH